MPARSELTDTNAIDIGKRYDVYLHSGRGAEAGALLVYRGVFFRGIKELEKEKGIFSVGTEFIEIEQSSGESVFLRKYSIVMFCEAGTKLGYEIVGSGHS
jgi:hypothetical protein